MTTCVKCGGAMIGDGYTSYLRCEFAPDTDEVYEADAAPVYCDFDDRELKITEIIFQSAQEGIPAHYAVQFIAKGATFVDYEYFGTESEANEFAAKHGYGG